MCHMPSCLVDVRARVYAVNGVHSHSEIATNFRLDEDRCLRYEFDLRTRTLVQDFATDRAPFEAKQSHDQAAQAWFNTIVGTPELLMDYVMKGNWIERDLKPLLTVEAEKICTATLAESRKIYDTTLAESRKICAATLAEARKIYDAARAEARKTCGAARAEAEKIYVATCTEAEKIYDAAFVEAWKICAATLAESRKIYGAAFVEAWLQLFANSTNRIEIWQEKTACRIVR